MPPIFFSVCGRFGIIRIQGNVNSGLLFDDNVLIIILFANDMIIVGQSPKELQGNICELNAHRTKWRLKVNKKNN